MLDAPEHAQALPSLVAQVGSPAYVYDLAEVRTNQLRLRAALPQGAGLYYSLKANPHPELLREIRAGGAHPEVCSPGELAAALAAGWPAHEVLYTGPGKRDVDLDWALGTGVRYFSVDSPAAMDQLDRCAAGRGVTVDLLLRVNDDTPTPGQGLAMTGVPSPFGADTAWVLAEPDRFASRRNARLAGLHLYMGSNLSQVDDLVAQFTHALRTAARLGEVLGEFEVLDLGGGFGAPFAAEGRAVPLDGMRERLTPLMPAGTRVVFESGRYLVGTAGTLVTSVLDAKRSHGREVVVLESGVNHLGGMSGLRRLPPLTPRLLTPRPGELVETMVVGPLCTPLDTWARAALLPRLQPGDLVAVPNVGAYGLTASLVGFLGHPLPAEVVVDRADPSFLHLSRLAMTRYPDRSDQPEE